MARATMRLLLLFPAALLFVYAGRALGGSRNGHGLSVVARSSSRSSAGDANASYSEQRRHGHARLGSELGLDWHSRRHSGRRKLDTAGHGHGHGHYMELRNERHKRGTKEHHKKGLKGGTRMGHNRAAPLSANTRNPSSSPSFTVLEPLPKPLALTSTDLPFDLTRNAEVYTQHVDNPWDATPMTPPYPEDEEKEYFPNPFYPVTSETYGAYAITCFSLLIFVVGVTANVAIMCVVCHNYYMRSISNALLANLAIWDLAMLLFCLPLVVFHELTKTWLLGQFTCKVVPYIEVNQSCARVLIGWRNAGYEAMMQDVEPERNDLPLTDIPVPIVFY
ncbi:hypothetical protein NFI96_002265 [Prochilodus magdalenae]|nr:hypothetical protein NFI96_002265 [Prochilodus magdalenae]